MPLLMWWWTARRKPPKSCIRQCQATVCVCLGGVLTSDYTQYDAVPECARNFVFIHEAPCSLFVRSHVCYNYINRIVLYYNTNQHWHIYSVTTHTHTHTNTSKCTCNAIKRKLFCVSNVIQMPRSVIIRWRFVEIRDIGRHFHQMNRVASSDIIIIIIICIQ